MLLSHSADLISPVHRNLSTIVSVPGGDSLQGFVLVTLLVEVAAIPAVKVSTNVISKESGLLGSAQRSVNRSWESLVMTCMKCGLLGYHLSVLCVCFLQSTGR